MLRSPIVRATKTRETLCRSWSAMGSPGPKPHRAAGALLLALGLAAVGVEAAGPAQAARRPVPKRAARRKSAPRPAARKPSPVKYVPEVLELGPGETDLLEVRMGNPYGHPTVGSLKLRSVPEVSMSETGWDGPLPAWGAKMYVRAKAAENAEPRRYTVKGSYYVDHAGDFRADLPVRVIIPITVELIPDYEGEAVRVRVKNLLSRRTERGKVELRSPDRFLEDQVSAILPPIPPGETREVSIPVVAGGIAPAESYRFEVTATTWAGYKTSFTRWLTFYESPR